MATALRAGWVKALGLLSTVGAFWLTGCGVGVLAGPTDTPGFKIAGNVHGGPLPIQGATIRLMTTASNGIWQASTNSYSGTATTQLTTTSNQYGYFTFPETGWACPAGQYAYVTVTGGHTAAQTNNNVVQVGVIGSCTDKLQNQTEYDGVNVFISELSTVAAAYALHDFITIDSSGAAGQQIVNITAPAADNQTDANAVCSNPGVNISCVHAGLGHAFLNAYNLVDSVTYVPGSFPTGTARTAVPGNAQSTVPQAEINTIGNIMQVCVDSGGNTVGNYTTYTIGTSRCGDFFYYTTPPGTTTSPTNTMQAVLNMVQNPTTKVDELFTLQPQVKFFTPAMTSDKMSGSGGQLMAYTISIFYQGTGLAGDNGMAYPVDLALDADDNVFVAYRPSTNITTNVSSAVNGFKSNGTGKFVGSQLLNLVNPASIAVDSLGNLFLTNDVATDNVTNFGNLYLLTASGKISTTYPNGLKVGAGYAAGVAVDQANNVWASRDVATGQSLFRFALNTTNGNYQSTNFQNNPTVKAATKRITISNFQNVLGVTSTTDTNNANPTTAPGSYISFPFGADGIGATLTQTGLTGSNGNAIAKRNNPDAVLMPLSKEVDSINIQNGNSIANGAGRFTGSSSTNYTSSNPLGFAIDGSGDLFWPDFSAAGQIFWLQPTSSASISSGTLTSFFPCSITNGQCSITESSNLRGMVIDSSGAIWYLADNSTGELVQTLGLGAPTYPLLSYARGGTIIDNGN